MSIFRLFMREVNREGLLDRGCCGCDLRDSAGRVVRSPSRDAEESRAIGVY